MVRAYGESVLPRWRLARLTGADTLVYHLAADGRVLQVAGRRWTDMVVSLPSIGQTVPARESSRLLLTLLR